MTTAGVDQLALALDATGELHLRLTEVLVHGWDLARTTGQSATFADETAEAYPR